MMSPKTILITGASDGIGLGAAKLLLKQGPEKVRLVLHGLNAKKLQKVVEELSPAAGSRIESYVADLSDLHAVDKLADQVLAKHKSLDVLINNAGVFKVSERAAFEFTKSDTGKYFDNDAGRFACHVHVVL